MSVSTPSEAARRARNDYIRKYNQEHREQVRAYHNKWQHEHPEKVKQYHRDYWERQAAKKAAEQINNDH